MNKTSTFFAAILAATLALADNSSPVTRPSSGGAAGDWDIDPVAWRRDGDAFVGDNAGRALAPSPKGRRVEIRARVTPQASRIPEYGSIGLAIFDDLDRYWNFAILKGPASKGSWHRYELKAQGNGQWGIEERLMTRVINKRAGEWEWGQPLDMTLSFSPERVEGVVTDAASGAELYRCAWVAKDGLPVPVPAGRPSIFTGDDFSGRVENVEWSVEDEVPDKTRDFPAYRPVGPETGIRGTATGFFHTEKIDGRDWAIDPLGRATVLAGTDWCNPQGSMCEKLGYRPYGRWVKQHYASTEEWAAETADRLGSWGFTVLPCGGDPSLFYRNLAWVNAADRVYFSHRMCRGDPNWRICEYRPAPCTAFPNVFHPDFEAACDWWARQRCAPYKDDPWLVGYFIDNELAWWGNVSANKATGLWDAIAKKPDTHPAKKAMLEYLAKQDMTAIASATPEQKLGFLRLAAERYFAATTAAIRRADPNHMVMGCRFAGGPNGVHPVVMEVAGKYCDVVSFNHYPWADLDRGVVFDSREKQVPVADLYREAHDRAGKPFFQTEWSFPALDTGRPCYHGAGQRFYTQAERVQACELYARTLLSLPFFAGYSFFRWVDLPALGIRSTFPEDSNYGLVNEENVPYEGLVSMFTRVHGAAARLRMAQPAASEERRVTSDERGGPAVFESERERYFAAAAGGSGGATPRSLSPVSFVREGDRWVLSNGLVRLSGRIGGAYMADEIAWTTQTPKNQNTQKTVGRWGALLQWDDHGSPEWTDISRVTDVSYAEDPATGIGTVTLRATNDGGAAPEPPLQGEFTAGHGDLNGEAAFHGEAGAPRFAFTHRLSLAPGAYEVLAEIVSLENIGSFPIGVQCLFMRPFAVEKNPGEADTVPNLWKGPVADYWLLADGSRFGIASHDPGVMKAKLWWREPDATQHPDVRCMVGAPFDLAPGETYAPPVPMGARLRFIPE